ncbi:MAG: hypothetical protein ACOH2H_24510 [Cypionkella sp.]
MSERLVGIQVGAVSLIDEGVGAVLDTVQERGVNTLFLASTTWNRASGGRAEAGRPFPDHGVAEYDPDWTGGTYATLHPEYYANTLLGAAGRAPEYPGWDIFDATLPEARSRGMKTYAMIDESAHAKALRRLPNFLKCLEVDIWNKPARRPCFNNPDYRNWHLGLIEDTIKTYDIDGLNWCSERPSPLDRLMQEPTRQGLGLIVCYCSHCLERAEKRGIDWRRAQEGYRKLVLWNADIADGKRPNDGAFVTFWRLLMTYPELLQWQALWIDGQHQMYRDIFGTVKAWRPEIQVGWTMYQNSSFSPFYRAGQNYADLSHICDFLKLATYDNAAGPRFHTWIAGISRTVFGDADPSLVYPLMQKILGLDEAPYEDLPRTGFSADYVRRETQRALVGGEGRCVIYAGIDVDVPVGASGAGQPAPADSTGIDHDTTSGPDLTRTTPERVTAAVRAAFAGGAAGVVLGRKYSEMNLANLAGLRGAVEQTV